MVVAVARDSESRQSNEHLTRTAEAPEYYRVAEDGHGDGDTERDGQDEPRVTPGQPVEPPVGRGNHAPGCGHVVSLEFDTHYTRPFRWISARRILPEALQTRPKAR